MTNFDLEEIYEFLSYVRYDPQNQKNIVLLDRLLDVLNEKAGDCSDFRELFYSKDHKYYVRNFYMLISEPHKKIVIEDNAVYDFFKLYLLEIKQLCITQRYRQVFYLIDALDNFPEEIIKNNLYLPIRKLKKCLIPYWRKYDKCFLKDFISDIKSNSKSLKTK